MEKRGQTSWLLKQVVAMSRKKRTSGGSRVDEDGSEEDQDDGNEDEEGDRKIHDEMRISSKT